MFHNFANSRLYKNEPLFDTPPKGYISALSGLDQSFDIPNKTESVAPITPASNGKAATSG